MNTKRKRVYFYTGAYFFIATFAIIGLMINIKTVPLNTHILKQSQQIKKLKEENRFLQFELAKKTALKHIHTKATSDLDMRLPKTIHYLEE